VAVCNFLGKIIRGDRLFWSRPNFGNPVDLYVPSVLVSGSPPIGLVVVVVLLHASSRQSNFSSPFITPRRWHLPNAPLATARRMLIVNQSRPQCFSRDGRIVLRQEIIYILAKLLALVAHVTPFLRAGK
jgi:hypothetical protein